MYVVLVCGSRRYSDRAKVEAFISELPPGTVIVHGAAPGADSLAGLFARKYDLECREYPADWAKYGSAAGPIRNQLMLNKEKVSKVVAFTDKPLRESKGTFDMVNRAIHQGIRVVLFEMNEAPVTKDPEPTLFSA